MFQESIILNAKFVKTVAAVPDVFKTAQLLLCNIVVLRVQVELLQF